MKENEWVSIKDAMPAMKRSIDVRFRFGVDDYECRSGIFDYSSHISGFCFVDPKDKIIFNQGYITHWRYSVKKRPDFSKLKKGDAIIVDYCVHTESKMIGFFCGIHKESNGDSLICVSTDLSNRSSGDVDKCFLEYVKKITRINLDTQKFEEI